jgi:ferredoxin-NADP reductase
MLNALASGGTGRPVWFIHGARSGREHAMGAHVRRLAAAHDNVHVHIRYSRPGQGDVAGRDYDSAGQVDAALLRALLPDPAELNVYLCGPAGFMKALYDGLIAWGMPEDRIRYEFFGPATVLRDRPAPASGADAAAADADMPRPQVTFARSDVSAAWDPSFASLLDFAEAQGLTPDFSCRSGICQTCMCALESGTVTYPEPPASPPDPGQVLICCAKPKTDVTIDI